MRIEGFGVGDTAWSVWVTLDRGMPLAEATAGVYLEEIEVVMPEGGIVRRPGGQPRVLYFFERLFATQQEARQWAATQIAAAAARLARQAADLAEPRVVTV
jgi:hypothetical protein